MLGTHVPSTTFSVVGGLIRPVSGFSCHGPGSRVPRRVRVLTITIFRFYATTSIPMVSKNNNKNSDSGSLH